MYCTYVVETVKVCHNPKSCIYIDVKLEKKKLHVFRGAHEDVCETDLFTTYEGEPGIFIYDTHMTIVACSGKRW